MDPVHEHSLFADFFNRNELLNLSPPSSSPGYIIGRGKVGIKYIRFFFLLMVDIKDF